MIRKRALILLIVFVLLLSNIQVLAAGDNEIDYKDYVRMVKKRYRSEHGKTFDTPTPIFKAIINGEAYTVKPFLKPYKAGEEQIEDNNLHQDSRKMEPHITIPVGTKISLEDISIGGDGRNIKLRDWQIYLRDKDFNEYDRVSSSNKSINNIKTDKEGYIIIFLNVADDLKYENYNNWSDKGNWEEGRISNFDYKGKKLVGWYFTAVKIEVIDQARPQAEFEIHYDNKNYTYNENNPVIVEKYPMSVDLKDKSTSEDSEIVNWDWQVWRNNKWETFSKE